MPNTTTIAPEHLVMAMNTHGDEIWHDIEYMQRPFLYLQRLFFAVNLVLHKKQKSPYNLDKKGLIHFLQQSRLLSERHPEINIRFNQFCKLIHADRRRTCVLNLHIGYDIESVGLVTTNQPLH